jgi:hypothetical protein
MEGFNMAKEEGIFTITEDEELQEGKEIISVAEEDIYGPVDESPLQQSYMMDTQYAKEEKKDWMKSGKPEHFVIFLENEMGRFPKPSDVSGNVSKIEQGLGQWKRLNNFVSKALREDYDGILDVELVDKARALIEQHIDQLEDMLDGINALKRNRKQLRKRRHAEQDNDLTKEATAPHFNGFQMTITPFQRAIAGSLINGSISGGRNIEELWDNAKKKYNMDDREELEILQILADMGYPEFKDRLRVGEQTDDPTRTENYGEWQSQYYA